MSIKAVIAADSINPQGKRLTTFILEYPRFVHSEFMTHRMFSKNAASSRAIPIEKMIQQVIDNPAMPVWWGKNQSGMQSKEEVDNVVRFPVEYCRKLSPENDKFLVREESFYLAGDTKKYKYYIYDLTKLEKVKIQWLIARDAAVEQVKILNELGLHKQISNRILEPWFNIRVICSATDYDNFFSLRFHEDAQPEICALAKEMLTEYNKSTPKKLIPGEWHIPMSDIFDNGRLLALENKIYNTNNNADNINSLKMKISVARCARISYLTYEGKDDYEADIKLCDRLFGSVPKHLSPTEHVAQCLDSSEYFGNFCGFKQYRKFLSEENLTDDRVIKHKYELL